MRFVALAAAFPLVLLLVRLLPAEGPGLALRLAIAAVCVLLVPGAVILRALGWPEEIGVAVAAALSLSLAVTFFALLLTFLASGSLSLALVVIVAITLTAATPAAIAPPVRHSRTDVRAACGTAVAGCALGGVVWWAAGAVSGDAMFHLSRVRKLDDFDAFTSLTSINEFRDGLLHPGYAFPLWHGVLALIARVAGVDPTEVVVHLNGILVPLAFVVAYAAGAILFRSWAGGVATVAAQAALVGLQRRGIGSFEFLALPATATARILPPALLAVAIAYLRSGSAALLVSLAGAALALAVIHAPYLFYVALALAGYLVARLLLAPDERRRVRRMAVAGAALAVGPLAFVAWLLPVIRGFAPVTPSPAVKAREIHQFRGYVVVMGDYLRIAPRAIARGGPATVAAFLAIPFAALGGRRRWVAYVLGAALAIFPVLLVPYLFTPFADLASLSQARRLAAFLPFPFALASAFVLLGRLRLAGAVLALTIGVVFQHFFPVEFSYKVGEGGPGWVVWFAFFGSALALVLAFFVRWAGPPAGSWGALAAVAFAVPLAVAGLSDVRKEPPDPNALTPGLVHALRNDARPGDVVFADLDVAFEAVTYAPVYIAAAPSSQVNVKAKNLYRRRLDVTRFFHERLTDRERRVILAKYRARWLLVRETDPYPAEFVRRLTLVYDDGRYALYRVVG